MTLTGENGRPDGKGCPPWPSVRSCTSRESAYPRQSTARSNTSAAIPMVDADTWQRSARTTRDCGQQPTLVLSGERHVGSPGATASPLPPADPGRRCPSCRLTAAAGAKSESSDSVVAAATHGPSADARRPRSLRNNSSCSRGSSHLRVLPGAPRMLEQPIGFLAGRGRESFLMSPCRAA